MVPGNQLIYIKLQKVRRREVETRISRDYVRHRWLLWREKYEESKPRHVTITHEMRGNGTYCLDFNSRQIFLCNSDNNEVSNLIQRWL